MVLTKAKLVHNLLEKTKLHKPEAIKFVELFFDEISSVLARGEDVKLTNFGNFVIHQKKARPGRNPKTGVPAMIKPRKVVTFHASHKLKAEIEKLKVKKK